MTKAKDKSELRATKLAARDAAIAERIKAGEKRYVLALDYGLTPTQISRISLRCGLPRWQRFRRQVNN